ncbi:MAG: hypothetical protein ACP5HI_07975 [Caldimicrobium sp.]|jgi:hypothetical protein
MVKVEGKELKVRPLKVLKRASREGIADIVILSIDVYGGDESFFSCF